MAELSDLLESVPEAMGDFVSCSGCEQALQSRLLGILSRQRLAPWGGPRAQLVTCCGCGAGWERWVPGPWQKSGPSHSRPVQVACGPSCGVEPSALHVFLSPPLSPLTAREDRWDSGMRRGWGVGICFLSVFRFHFLLQTPPTS